MRSSTEFVRGQRQRKRRTLGRSRVAQQGCLLIKGPHTHTTFVKASTALRRTKLSPLQARAARHANPELKRALFCMPIPTRRPPPPVGNNPAAHLILLFFLQNILPISRISRFPSVLPITRSLLRHRDTPLNYPHIPVSTLKNIPFQHFNPQT